MIIENGIVQTVVVSNFEVKNVTTIAGGFESQNRIYTF